MRTVTSSLFVVAVLASPAVADNDVIFEIGYVRNQIAVTDETALDGQAVRFSIRIDRGRFFHAGVEAEEGILSGTTRLPGGAVARLAPDVEMSPDVTTPLGPESPLDGNTLALKMFGGVHTNLGPRVQVASDLALGFRDTWVDSDLGKDIAGYKMAPLLEVRSRIDVLLSQRMALGAIATTNLGESRDKSLGLVLGMRFR
jgi:hypothetical protein